MRYLEPYIIKDLQKKMVFVGGPRQCGKTTLAKTILNQEALGGRYLNWDDDDDRSIILNKTWLSKEKLLIFDEVHKYPKWKNWIKGLYDKRHEEHRILVTGSARLDLYKKGGDSLLGRYHYWRLHPFTLEERPESMSREEAMNRLMTVGGFPEPFLSGDETEARRWRRERFDRVIKSDIRDLEQVRDLTLLGLFVDELRRRVGSIISLNKIAMDLQIAPKTAKHWLQILENMYMIFAIYPYTGKLSRAIQKPPKVFFFDTGDVQGDEGAKFENLVATHLLKRIHFLEDSTGFRYNLCYMRDKEKHEVDFVILKENQPVAMIECKWKDHHISKGLTYFSERVSVPMVLQLVSGLKSSYQSGHIIVQNAEDFLEKPIF